MIPIDRNTRQAPDPEPVPDDPAPAKAPGALTVEAQVAAAALRKAAENSVWATEPATAVDAWKQVLPSKGEAGNWIFWVAMTAAGLCRALWNSAGHLILLGTDTRTKAAVATVALLIALSLAFLAGHTA